MSILISKQLGSFDFAHPQDKQFQVRVRFDNDHALSELWDGDDAFDIDGMPPSEIVERISERVESYWISTSRNEKRKIIAWARERASALDWQWAQEEAERLNKRATRLQQEAERLLQDYRPTPEDDDALARARGETP